MTCPPLEHFGQGTDLSINQLPVAMRNGLAHTGSPWRIRSDFFGALPPSKPVPTSDQMYYVNNLVFIGMILPREITTCNVKAKGNCCDKTNETQFIKTVNESSRSTPQNQYHPELVCRIEAKGVSGLIVRIPECHFEKRQFPDPDTQSSKVTCLTYMSRDDFPFR